MSERFALTVNAGSSSLRLDIFRGSCAQKIASQHETGAAHSFDVADWFRRQAGVRPTVVVHRVVHGGRRFVAPTVIDDAVENAIRDLTPLAPLHNPAALHWIHALRATWGSAVRHIAVFDTAFYAELPEAVARYALPELRTPEPLRRYGFHGIAHQAMLGAWQEQQPASTPPERTISLQLGSGCSITAAVDGRPVETSMGLTPLEGLVMATRCGDVDPGVLLYLLREGGHSVAALDDLLNHRSGLLGISGSTGDMRELLASEEDAAKLAVEIYCHRIRKYLGGYLAVLGGADAILFGGGVGEHSAEIRQRVLEGLEFAGLVVSRQRNEAANARLAPIHADDSKVAAWVVPVDEAQILAREGFRVLQSLP